MGKRHTPMSLSRGEFQKNISHGKSVNPENLGSDNYLNPKQDQI
ncbi:MAG: hypothetical protein AB7S75_22315 [Desulfococcaceae bacterium]